MTEKIKIQEVLVIEGKDDTANLRRFYDMDTYEAHGPVINDDNLEHIEKSDDLCGIIVFTDSDYNGERIRKIIMNAIPNVKHAFLNRDEAAPRSKSKGRSPDVEHVSFEDSQKALSGILENFDDDNQLDITRADLMRMEPLIGNDSRRCREYLSGKLRIGYSNDKQLLKCSELFGIILVGVEEATERYEE